MGIAVILGELANWFEGPEGKGIVEIVVTPRGYDRIVSALLPLLRHGDYAALMGRQDIKISGITIRQQR